MKAKGILNEVKAKPKTKLMLSQYGSRKEFTTKIVSELGSGESESLLLDLGLNKNGVGSGIQESERLCNIRLGIEQKWCQKWDPVNLKGC